MPGQIEHWKTKKIKNQLFRVFKVFLKSEVRFNPREVRFTSHLSDSHWWCKAHKLQCIINECSYMLHWRIQGAPSPRFNFVNFHAVFWQKSCQIIGNWPKFSCWYHIPPPAVWEIMDLPKCFYII